MLKRRILKRPLLTLALFIPACWLMNFLCFGFSVELFPMQRLESARATWEANNIQNYRMTLHPVQRLSVVQGDFQVTVVDGEVVAVAARDVFDANGPFTPIDDFETYTVGAPLLILPSNITNYTVSFLLETVAAQIEDLPPIHLTRCGDGQYGLDFDSQLGYVRSFSYTSHNGISEGIDLWCAGLHEIDEAFTITEFEVLSD
jgi:hypothetical protein